MIIADKSEENTADDVEVLKELLNGAQKFFNTHKLKHIINALKVKI